MSSVLMFGALLRHETDLERIVQFYKHHIPTVLCSLPDSILNALLYCIVLSSLANICAVSIQMLILIHAGDVASTCTPALAC